jgi:hypothetical protein
VQLRIERKTPQLIDPVPLAKPPARRLSDNTISASKPSTIDYSSPKLVIAIHQTC